MDRKGLEQSDVCGGGGKFGEGRGGGGSGLAVFWGLLRGRFWGEGVLRRRITELLDVKGMGEGDVAGLIRSFQRRILKRAKIRKRVL